MFKTKLTLIAASLFAASFAQAQAWDEKFYNPKPLDGDVILPMPCEGNMVFRKVETETHSPLDEKQVTLGADGTVDQMAEYSTPNYIAGGFSEKGKSRYFLMAKYEISQLQYRAVMDAECPSPNMKGRLPITDVSWFEAVEFSRKYNEWLLKNHPDKVPTEDNKKGFVRLPTNTEWEFASRGGAVVSPSEFRENLFPMKDGAEKYSWSSKNANGKLQLTGLLEGNPLGLFDTLGNVSEMMFDTFKLNRLDHYHGQSGGIVVRGGSYLNSPDSVNNVYRVERGFYDDHGSVYKAKDLGFRLVFAAPLLTSSQRINDLKAEWQKLGRDDKEGAAQGANVVGKLEQITANVKDEKIEKEALEKELTSLNDTLRQANQMRDEQRSAAIQASLRMGSFLCPLLNDYSITHQRAKTLLENASKNCDLNNPDPDPISVCSKERITTMQDKEKSAKDELENAKKYYADTLVEMATTYNPELIKEQVEPTTQNLLRRGAKNNAAKFVKVYWEQLSQYQKDGKIDREHWLQLCEQASN